MKKIKNFVNNMQNGTCTKKNKQNVLEVWQKF